MEITVNGNKKIMLSKDDSCPICGSGRENMYFAWRMFHGEADSSCCGAIYQIKGYHIDKPTDEDKKYLEMLDGEYIECTIKPEWIKPLKEALELTGETDINSGDVIKIAGEAVSIEAA